MAVSGRNLNAVKSEYGSGITGSPPHMNTMAGRTYYKLIGAVGVSNTFPASSISLNSMYLTSPDNEWPSDCACACNCGK